MEFAFVVNELRLKCQRDAAINIVIFHEQDEFDIDQVLDHFLHPLEDGDDRTLAVDDLVVVVVDDHHPDVVGAIAHTVPNMHWLLKTSHPV